ncbi:MAG: DUF3419 family protein [Betaproteobacteria bacterium]|nr:DUF3419 family protein [Betaproteobacteria bacterium]
MSKEDRGQRLQRDDFTILDRIDQKVFDAIYSRSLVYNTCWEDPAVDRRALGITPEDRMLVITSAGCNALDYLLSGPRRVYAVDANPRQSALLELKVAGIRRLAFADFFHVFGYGRHPQFRALYHDALRAELSNFARHYWDARLHWFTHPEREGSFYFHGLSGVVARAFRLLLRLRPALADAVDAMLDARSLDEQRDIYECRVRPRLWQGPMRWILSRQITMSMLGVPHPQRREVESQHTDGVAGYIRSSIDYVLRTFPIRENYFWFVYLRGHYTPETCPRYLQRDHFERLKAGLVDRLTLRTATVTDFLQHSSESISKFVLLDHMDWMACYHPAALAQEWRCIFDRAASGARAIFRSAHASPRYLAEVPITYGLSTRPLSDWLRFQPGLAAELSRDDRVHTYCGFHVADVPT